MEHEVKAWEERLLKRFLSHKKVKTTEDDLHFPSFRDCVAYERIPVSLNSRLYKKVHKVNGCFFGVVQDEFTGDFPLGFIHEVYEEFYRTEEGKILKGYCFWNGKPFLFFPEPVLVKEVPSEPVFNVYDERGYVLRSFVSRAAAENELGKDFFRLRSPYTKVVIHEHSIIVC